MNVLIAIHEVGLEHSCPNESHVLVSRHGSGIRIADFYRARHQCDPRLSIGQPYDYAPLADDFTCGELREYAVRKE